MTAPIRPAVATDLPTIDHIFRTSFCDTFAHLYTPEDLAAFLATLTPQSWADQFADPALAFAVGGGDAITGFAKIGPNKLPHVAPDGVLELRQLYLLKAAHGTGLADALIDWALREARGRGAERMALSVWSENWRAQAFYRRHGFVDRGPVIFMVGKQADEDRVWERTL